MAKRSKTLPRSLVCTNGEVPAEAPLLATKLHKPQLPSQFLRRQRLLDDLEKGAELPLVLVSAPAGYGKSSLVAEWLEESERPVTWLSLDQSDSDLPVFLSYLVAAIETRFPNACAMTKSALAATDIPVGKVLAGLFANDLDAIEASFTMVLDDYHLIEGAAVHDLISELLRHPAANVHWVIVTRRDPPLPLVSLRASHRMIEIRFDDLEFARGEVVTLMEDTLGVNLSDPAMDRLMEISEGWVAGLQLVALAMRNRPDPDEFLLNLRGTIRDVRDYLLSEVLAQQPEGLRECLLKTAVVDRFSGSFCEMVCDKCEDCPMAGEQMMENLARSGIFTIPLDAEGKWFRYHHLFQELLREQLEREVGADRVAALHDRGSRWFEELGSIGEAIDHSLKAGDPERAAKLVETHRIAEFNADRWFVVENWLGKIPAEVKPSRPGIILAQAWIRYNQIRLTELATLVAQAELCLTEVGEGEREGLIGEVNFHKAILRFWQGDAEGVLELVGKAKHQLPPQFLFVRSDLDVYWGFGNQMCGRSEQAVEELERLLRADQESNPMMVTRRIAAIGFVHLLDCQTAAVRQAAIRLRDAAEKYHLQNTMLWASYIHGISCFQSGDFETARLYLREIADNRHALHRYAALHGVAGLALTCEAMGRHDEADEVDALFQEFARESSFPSDLSIADSCRARVALWRGEPDRAARLLPPYRGKPDAAALVFFVESPCVTQCRLLLANASEQGIATAVKMLADLRQGLADLHNTFHLIDVMVLEARGLQLMGETGEAKETFETALRLAEPGWWIRPFLEVGEPAIEWLDAADDGRSPFREEIRSRIHERVGVGKDRTAAPEREPAAKNERHQPLIEPLTNRERDVLELIGKRLYDKEIADRLSISPGTVKTHLKHIYQKLDVGNRRAAVERASALGIL